MCPSRWPCQGLRNPVQKGKRERERKGINIGDKGRRERKREEKDEGRRERKREKERKGVYRDLPKRWALNKQVEVSNR